MKCVCIGLAAAVAVTLHGCGGDTTTTPSPPAPASTTPAPAPAPASPTTTAPPVPPPDPTPSGPDGQFSGPDAATYLNNHYMAWSPDDDASHMGVTIDMRPDGEFEFFCATNGSSCYKGNADCRISASIANNRVMVTNTSRFAGIMRRTQGIAFNQTTVEAQLAKCSYVYDGASDRRLNGGCGCGALAEDANCNDTMSAYNNNDCAYSHPFDGAACTAACEANSSACMKANPTTENVDTCYCSSPHFASMHPGYDEDSTLTSQCFFKAPTFFNGTTTPDETREMLKRRIVSQAVEPVNEVINLETGETRYKPAYWTEVVLDARPMFEILHTKPAHAIVAFIYDKANPVGKINAQKMADRMKAEYHMHQPVPIVAFDSTVNVTETAPFSFESSNTFLSFAV